MDAPCSRNNLTAAMPDRAIPTTTTFKPSSFTQTSKTDSLTVAAHLAASADVLPNRDRKGVGHFYLSFNVVNANKAITNPAIQNRVMIFDYFQTFKFQPTLENRLPNGRGSVSGICRRVTEPRP